MRDETSVSGWPAWMLRLPLWMRSFMARRWRRFATMRALQANATLLDAKALRDEARRLEALADWIDPARESEP